VQAHATRGGVDTACRLDLSVPQHRCPSSGPRFNYNQAREKEDAKTIESVDAGSGVNRTVDVAMAAKPRHASRPSIRILGKARPLHADDAEPLPTRGLHHHPAFQAVDDTGTQFFKALHLGRNVISFDIDMHPALMIDALKLHDRLVRRCLQHAVVAASAWMAGIDRPPQRLGPEAGGLIDIVDVAVD